MSNNPKIRTITDIIDEPIRQLFFNEIKDRKLANCGKEMRYILSARSKTLMDNKRKESLLRDLKKMFTSTPPVNIPTELFFYEKNNWTTRVKGFEKTKENYVKVYNKYKRLISLEPVERNTSGITTIIYLFILLSSYLFALLVSTKKSHYFHSAGYFIEILGLMCHLYCVYVVYISFKLKKLKKKSDPYRYISKIIKHNWHGIECSLDENEYFNENFYFRDINASELDKELYTLTGLAIESYGISNIGLWERKEKYKAWYTTRKDIFSFICNSKNDKIIGYICILPLKNFSEGRNHLDRRISQFDIDSNMLATDETELMFLQGMYLQPEYANDFAAIITLLECFYVKVADFMNDTSEKTNQTFIYAEPVTDLNNEMLETMGFRYRGRTSKNLHKIFEFDFNLNGEESENNFKPGKQNSVIKSIDRIKKIKNRLNGIELSCQ